MTTPFVRKLWQPGTDVSGRKSPLPASALGRGLVAILLFLSHAAGMAVVLVPISLALHVPARRWLVAYAALNTCAIVLVPGIFWAWAGWDRPNGYARRMGITMFVFMQLMIVALGVSGIEVGLLTRSDMLSGLPFMMGAVAVIGIVSYRMMLRMFGTAKAEQRIPKAESEV